MAREMNELRILRTGPGFAYYGDRDGWWVAASVHRESDALERSNWHTVTADILGMRDQSAKEDMLADAAVERTSHFLVGWVDYLLVRPGTPQAARALDWHHRLELCPVADEVDLRTLLWNEEWCVRCDRATREEHASESGPACTKFRSKDDAIEIRRRWRTRSTKRMLS
jgi:hypothetical protein